MSQNSCALFLTCVKPPRVRCTRLCRGSCCKRSQHDLEPSASDDMACVVSHVDPQQYDSFGYLYTAVRPLCSLCPHSLDVVVPRADHRVSGRGYQREDTAPKEGYPAKCFPQQLLGRQLQHPNWQIVLKLWWQFSTGVAELRVVLAGEYWLLWTGPL